MFPKEANGLQALSQKLSALPGSTALQVPKTIKYGTVQQQQYLLLEWLEPGKPANGFWESFGTALALLHQQPQPYYGWECDNYIGSLIQFNAKQDSWPLFYRECRIMPLVKSLVDAGIFTSQDFTTAELFCRRTSELFPTEPPAMLHGDLWSGNFMTLADGNPAIYDPAVYYGHREMDLGMTKLFGGFDQRFYDAYHQVYPLQKDWLKRLPLTQLYPLLVHAVLFGGHYVMNARAIMQQF
jgi:fructosamine-3-kinase